MSTSSQGRLPGFVFCPSDKRIIRILIDKQEPQHPPAPNVDIPTLNHDTEPWKMALEESAMMGGLKDDKYYFFTQRRWLPGKRPDRRAGTGGCWCDTGNTTLIAVKGTKDGGSSQVVGRKTILMFMDVASGDQKTNHEKLVPTNYMMDEFTAEDPRDGSRFQDLALCRIRMSNRLGDGTKVGVPAPFPNSQVPALPQTLPQGEAPTQQLQEAIMDATRAMSQHHLEATQVVCDNPPLQEVPQPNQTADDLEAPGADQDTLL